MIDDELAVVGSANMDYRNFDLNFEVNAVLFSKKINGQLQKAFENDINRASEINADQWLNRPNTSIFGKNLYACFLHFCDFRKTRTSSINDCSVFTII